MKTETEILRQRRALLVIAADGSPVPDSVRWKARDLVHTLSWVLGESRPALIALRGGPLRTGLGMATGEHSDFETGSLGDVDRIEPYYILAGCCCLRDESFLESMRSGKCTADNPGLACAIGSGMCLCPGTKPRRAPDVPEL